MIILYVLIFVTNFIQAVKSIMVEDYTWAILQLLVVAASILCISRESVTRRYYRNHN